MRATIAQNPDDAHSDDKVFVTNNAIVVLDGASAFLSVPVAASTYASTLGMYLARLLTETPDIELHELLRIGIQSTAKNLDLSPGSSPSSTVTILRQRDTFIDLLTLGDNAIIFPDTTIIDDRINRVARIERSKYQNRLATGGQYDDEHHNLLRQLQTVQRQNRNQPDGYWIAEADPNAAGHALTATRQVSSTPWAIVATDGAYNTMKYLHLINPGRLLAARHSYLAKVLQKCRTWEAEHDPDGHQLPRAKRHDDKSLAVLTFEQVHSG